MEQRQLEQYEILDIIIKLAETLDDNYIQEVIDEMWLIQDQRK